MLRTADAVLAVAGGYGTLSEFALALKIGLPVVGRGTWDIPGMEQADTPEDAARLALLRTREATRGWAPGRPATPGSVPGWWDG